MRDLEARTAAHAGREVLTRPFVGPRARGERANRIFVQALQRGFRRYLAGRSHVWSSDFAALGRELVRPRGLRGAAAGTDVRPRCRRARAPRRMPRRPRRAARGAAADRRAPPVASDSRATRGWPRAGRGAGAPRRPARHGDGDGVIEHDDWRRLAATKDARRARRSAANPCRPGAPRARGAPRWQLCNAKASGGRGAQRVLDERETLPDLRLVPARPVLLCEDDQVAVRRDPRLAPRVVQQHAGRASARADRLGMRPTSRRPEADGLGRGVIAPHEIVARRRGVSFVEDEVDDRHDGVDALGKLVLLGDAVGMPGVADLLFRANESLRHRTAGTEAEGARDLLGPRLSPASVRSVSATWASTARAGWQQVNMRPSRSSGSRASDGSSVSGGSEASARASVHRLLRAPRGLGAAHRRWPCGAPRE